MLIPGLQRSSRPALVKINIGFIQQIQLLGEIVIIVVLDDAFLRKFRTRRHGARPVADRWQGDDHDAQMLLSLRNLLNKL